ncbi:MAG: hypothetical protein HZA14_01830 [Nitrospirae bacterium]|nr:hypothetical protein [Nitrospirota bacterium]
MRKLFPPLQILLLASCILHPASSFAGEDSVRLLQRAYESGELNYQTALNYKVDAVFNKKKLPGAYQSDTPIKSATRVILEARQNSSLLYKENEFVLFRPTDQGDEDYYGTGIAVWTYDSPGGHFKIHYTEDNTYGDAVYGFDGMQATVPQYVTDLAGDLEDPGYLENSWTQVITNMGYSAPPSDAPAGGDDKLDVYLVEMDAYGYTSFDSGPSDIYIVLENDFTGFPENLDHEQRQGAQKTTAAHEFFHTSQLQYTTNVLANGWWMEAASTWMEDVVYPGVKDYLNYSGFKFNDANDNGRWDSGETWYKIDGSTIEGAAGRPNRWFDRPEYSLNSTEGSHEYGTIVFVKYLSKTYGSDAIKSVWDRIGSGATALDAISNEILSRGASLSAAFGSFQTANYKRDYPDGAYYPLVRHEATYASYPQSISGTVNHLSSRYYAFKPEDASSTISFTFNNMDSGNLAVKLILTKTSGGYDEQDITLNGSPVSYQINSFGSASTYSKIVMTVMNISPSQDGAAYSVSAEKAGSSSGGGGCFIATAAYGSYLSEEVQVLRSFRDEWLIADFRLRIADYKIEITNIPGKAFVNLYYKCSPPIADYISRHAALKITARSVLTPVVYAIKYPAHALIVICISAFVLTRKMQPGANKRGNRMIVR